MRQLVQRSSLFLILMFGVVSTNFGKEQPKSKPAHVAVKRARLAAANQLNVQLTYDYKGTERQAAGKLMSVGDEFVVLESSSNSFAVPVDAISRLQVLELPLRIHVASELEKPAETTNL